MGLCTTQEQNLDLDAPNIIQVVSFGPIQVQLIHGYYKLLRAEYLVSIIEQQNAIKSNVLIESVTCPKDLLAEMINSKKFIEITNSPRGLGFKKVITCLLPTYNTISTQQYISLFQKILTQIFKKGKNFIMVFNQTDDINNLPNQMLISVILAHMSKRENHEKVQKIQFVSQQRNIINLFRLEVQKAHLRLSQSLLLEVSK